MRKISSKTSKKAQMKIPTLDNILPIELVKLKNIVTNYNVKQKWDEGVFYLQINFKIDAK